MMVERLKFKKSSSQRSGTLFGNTTASKHTTYGKASMRIDFVDHNSDESERKGQRRGIMTGERMVWGYKVSIAYIFFFAKP